VLGELNAGEIPMITVLNKIDKIESDQIEEFLSRYPGSVAISALKGSGLSELCTRIESSLALQKKLQQKGA
jgi:50S ribosomal subunit-associated GTPase HflX